MHSIVSIYQIVNILALSPYKQYIGYAHMGMERSGIIIAYEHNLQGLCD